VRILILSDYFPPHIGGGVEKVAEQLSSHLARRGHEVRVLTLRTRPGAPLAESACGVAIQRVPAADLTARLGFQAAWSWGLLPAVWKAVRDFRPELVHAHNLFFRTTESVVVPRVLNGAPLVTTIHLGKAAGSGLLLRTMTGAYERTVGRRVVRRSDRLIAVSEAVADHARALGARPQTIDVIPNGVDLDVFKPRQVPRNGPPRVLFVGRLVPNKGPEVLVRAAPWVLERFPEVEFVVCGDGPMRGALEREAKRLGVMRAFRFLGLVTDVPRVMQDGSVLVRPSTLEGMPLSVLEAMACGLPVVATNVGGTPELVKHGTHGYLFHPGDVNGLAGYLMVLLGNPKVAAAFGTAGRRAVETGWSWAEMSRRTEVVYERTLSPDRKGARVVAA
jgi:1,4-alpha-glucan branching enzyme